MKLAQYEQAFAAAGVTTLSFDFRHLGASGGEPRQVISLRRHLQDVEAAWSHLRQLPEVDAGRVGLWGTSLGATHVLRVAARQPQVAAVVIQCPIVHGLSAARSSGLAHLVGLTPDLVRDVWRSVTRRPRHYVGIVGQPGDHAMVTVPGAYAGWESVTPDDCTFDNRVAAAAGFELIVSNAARRARHVRCPLLVCVPDLEELTDPRIAARVATRAQHGTARHYAAGHFGVYHPPLVDQIIRDQVEFLTGALAPDKQLDP
jgi:alpha/beta superfamily hydrolase